MSTPSEMSEVLAPATSTAKLRDFAALGKPRLSGLVIFTAAIGVFFGYDGYGSYTAALGPLRTVVFLFATSFLVAAANTLNCWIEIELDALMERTRDRPLPARRMEPRAALVSGVLLAAGSLSALYASTNLLTTGLGLVALFSYVLIYTPLKRITPWALVVGAVPGALPPLMGWTAATDTLATPGWVLFGILFFWQLPHFLAISLYLKEDFRRAGFQVFPVSRGDVVARRYLLGFTVLLVAMTLAVQPLGLAGAIYTAFAVALGIGFLVLAAIGTRNTEMVWARRIFAYTLLYLPVLISVLVLDAR